MNKSTIITGRLLLRPLKAGDGHSLVAGLNNFNVSQWTARVPFPYGLADAEEFLQLCEGPAPGMQRFAITLNSDVIGVISYKRAREGDVAELGYWLAEPYWGRGFGREAARAVTDHAFDSGLDELAAGYRHGNEGSRRILEGLGFVKTGDAMMFSQAVGAETPVARMRLTRQDWHHAKGRRK